MPQDSMEIALRKYNKKTWGKSALLGFFIGLAVIVPGISGSTVAIIFKLYDEFLYAVGNLFKKFKACFLFFLPIGIGLAFGFLSGLIGVQQLLDKNMFAIVCLFAGLMLGAFPAVKDELKGATWSAKRVILFIVGLLIPVFMGGMSALNTADALKTQQTVSAETMQNIFDNVQVWQVLLALVFGFVVGITQIVPGLSASAFLMMVGWYRSLMAGVSLHYWLENPAVLLIYAGLGIGFLLGIFSFSKLLTSLFQTARHTAYSMIVGLSLGSIISMFCNGDIVQVYINWATNGVATMDVVLGVLLLAIGSFGAYLLVRYQRKKDNEAENR